MSIWNAAAGGSDSHVRIVDLYIGRALPIGLRRPERVIRGLIRAGANFFARVDIYADRPIRQLRAKIHSVLQTTQFP
jgi:hypothetical protein